MITLNLRKKTVLVILLASLIAMPFYLAYSKEIPPKVPISIHEVVYANELGYVDKVGDSYHWRITVSSTEAFEIKAIYFQLEDPDVQIDDMIFTALYYNDTTESGSTTFKINIPNSYFHYYPSSYGGHMEVELLSYMVNLQPAGSSGDSVILYFYAHPEDPDEGIDGNQSVYIKAIVESAHQATVNVTLIPGWPET